MELGEVFQGKKEKITFYLYTQALKGIAWPVFSEACKDICEETEKRGARTKNVGEEKERIGKPRPLGFGVFMNDNLQAPHFLGSQTQCQGTVLKKLLSKLISLPK